MLEKGKHSAISYTLHTINQCFSFFFFPCRHSASTESMLFLSKHKWFVKRSINKNMILRRGKKKKKKKDYK